MAKDEEKTDQSINDMTGTGNKKEIKKKKKMKSSKKDKDSKRTEEQGQDNGRPWGNENPPVSGPDHRTVRVKRRRNQREEHDYSESGGNFLSRISPKHILGAAGVVASGVLIFKGVKGEWPFTKKNLEEINLNSKETIDVPREELYSYWRKFENLPRFMSHIKEVEEIDEKRSEWTAEIPGGLGTIVWEAVIDEERENEYISWKSMPGAEIENSGHVRFQDEVNGKGTVVQTTISYRPPAGGELGERAAKLFNPAFEKVVKTDLKQFKKHMEKGDEKKRKSSKA